MNAFFEKSKAFLKNNKTSIKRLFIFIGFVCVLVFLSICILNIAIVAKTDSQIYGVENIEDLSSEYDCILVLGAGVRADGSPTPMLADRLMTAVEAYKEGRSAVVFVSGDSEYEDYRETDTMKAVLVKNGVPEENIVCDGYGLSTYESMWRIKNVYGYEKILVVTQKYHLHRAIYIADKMGIEAQGLDAALQSYGKQVIYSAREYIARVKDFYFTLKMPYPKYTEKH